MAIKDGNTRITVTVTPEELEALEVMRGRLGVSSVGKAAAHCVRTYCEQEIRADDAECAASYLAGLLVGQSWHCRNWQDVQWLMECASCEAASRFERVAADAVARQLTRQDALYGGLERESYAAWCAANGKETCLPE